MSLSVSVLLTGATGFVGRTLIDHLLTSECRVNALVRTISSELPPSVKQLQGNLSDELDLNGVDVVIHAAARVHIMRDTAADPQKECDNVNLEGTINIARQAAKAGVKRFIFISTIKVNGEITIDRPFTADDTPCPSDPYAISKNKAEMALLALAKDTGMEVVIIRPPLVYGPGVKANFRSMLNWVRKGLPLPLGAVNNQRSLVYIDNLCDLIITCINHPKAKDEIFLVSDGEDVSISTLLRKIAKAQGVSSRLISMPPQLLVLLAKLFGKEAQAQRLIGSLQVDMQKTQELLGWAPLISLDEGIKRTIGARIKVK